MIAWSLLLIAAQRPPASGPPVARLLAEAQAKAKGKRKIFVQFSASWCGPCKKLRAMIADPKFAAVFDKHFVYMYVSTDEDDAHRKFESPDFAEWQARWKVSHSLPVFAIVDGDNRVVENPKLDFRATGDGSASDVPAVLSFLKVLSLADPTITKDELWKLRGAWEDILRKDNEGRLP